jgi:hypothetical protein
VTFDLDALERESTPEPFTFTVSGESFTVEDMQNRDWQDLLSLGDDVEASLKFALGDDQYAHFRSIRGLPSWKLERLVRAMAEHFGIGSPEKDDGSSGS